MLARDCLTQGRCLERLARRRTHASSSYAVWATAAVRHIVANGTQVAKAQEVVAGAPCLGLLNCSLLSLCSVCVLSILTVFLVLSIVPSAIVASVLTPRLLIGLL
jgi:hypothetical protein